MSYFADYWNGVSQTLQAVRDQESMIQGIAETILSAERVFVVGNGGSMSTAMHFAEDLLTAGVRALAISDPAYLTMAGNDYGFSHAFVPFIQNQVTERDVVVGISTSGNSSNVMNALIAHQGARIGLIGRANSVMRRYCQLFIELNVEETLRGTKLAEDAHLIICHAISEWCKVEVQRRAKTPALETA